MKTKLFAAFLFMSIAASAQYTLIPDVDFENKLISLGIDSGMLDGRVFTDNIKSVDSLDLRYSNISSLAGIESFTALSSLLCYGNHLTTLDVTKNTALTYLDCGVNQLTSLDVSKNTALTTLRCYNNEITSLDVSKNPA